MPIASVAEPGFAVVNSGHLESQSRPRVGVVVTGGGGRRDGQNYVIVRYFSQNDRITAFQLPMLPLACNV